MIFEEKFRRARELQKEQNAAKAAGRPDEQNDLEIADIMEKGDTFAMIVSAFLTIVPIALIVLIVLAAAGYFFIVR